ncbi:helix-turn-helix domain-containing protein [Tunicatimonas pelagia]|uniref:helix-turn-helix domain-containing protein n=1 Tax=Tunicatimonas pelagia TaxID=931531 RepID=UPI0026668323|nr:AraC family transcriptional regulator [Tunicatimonas pelagia]WKN41113.1 AraC family transcriptional regulator [Tunicatimonas pelagia]
MNGIPLYQEINDLHRLTGSHLRTRNPLFHCFNMAEANELEQTTTQPHRTSFYTLALNFGTKNLSYSLNETTFDQPDNFILCVAPGQIAQWEKQGDWFGFCTFFKSEFLDFSEQVNFLHQYPFFNINETNLISVGAADFEPLKLLFQLIIEEQASEEKFSREVIKSHFQAILWKVRRIYEIHSGDNPRDRAGAVITAQFQYLVNEHFLTKTTIEEYADLLNISANHLSQTISNNLGRTAKTVISKRRVKEARYLLAYTTQPISAIAFHLGFSEPTHFTKFFKKLTEVTPQTYRANNS